MKFSLVILSILLTSTSIGQHSIGLKGGLSFGWLSGNISGIDNVPHAGFSGGINYQYKFRNRLVLGSGLDFTQDGQDFSFTFVDNQGNSSGESRVKTVFNRIILPLTIGYTFGKNVFIKPLLGLTVDYTFSAYFKYPDGLIPNTSKIDFSNQVKPINLSVIGGVEIEKTLGSFALFGALNFRHSLTHIYTDEFSSPDFRVGLFSLRIQIGCRFFLNSNTNQE